MKILQTLGKGQGYLKAGFLGFQKSGKTFTACLLSVATRERFGLKGPIVFVDTENASEYVSPLVKQLTGADLIGVRTRKFDDLLTAATEASEMGAAVFVADSMTHFWRSLCDSYLVGLNETRRRYNKPPRLKLEFQDWGQVKGQWAKWTDVFLNLPMHMIICGRAGYEYDMEKNEETGRNELVKTGVKMKTEAEFGFEPSLLVQMESDQEPDPNRAGKFKLIRTATVIGDRYGVIDGKVFSFHGIDKDRKAELKAVADSFGPHLEMLKPGSHSTVSTNPGSMPVDEDGDVEWSRERKARTILCEEIQGCMVSAIPGQAADDKKRKADILNQVFGTRSWTAVENMPSEKLREGFAKLRAALGIRSEFDAKSDDGDLGPVSPAPFPVAAPTTGQAPTAAPAPVVPETPAVSNIESVKPPQDLSSLLMQAVGADALGKAVAWMIKNGWLTKEQAQADNPFVHVAEKNAKKVIAEPARFLRAIGA